jgi:beta-glucosidase
MSIVLCGCALTSLNFSGRRHWSTMDNLEWIFGHEPKFGLFRVEAKTLKQTPKMSASWFRETARRNAVA